MPSAPPRAPRVSAAHANLPSSRWVPLSSCPWSLWVVTVPAGSAQSTHVRVPGLQPTPCVFIPGAEGPEEGPARGAPQVRAAPGPARQGRPGGPRPGRGAGPPGRALAPPRRHPAAPVEARALCAMPVSYTQVQAPSDPTRPDPTQAVTPSRLGSRPEVKQGGPPGSDCRAAGAHGVAPPPRTPWPRAPGRSQIRQSPKVRAKAGALVARATFCPDGICGHSRQRP